MGKYILLTFLLCLSGLSNQQLAFLDDAITERCPVVTCSFISNKDNYCVNSKYDSAKKFRNVSFFPPSVENTIKGIDHCYYTREYIFSTTSLYFEKYVKEKDSDAQYRLPGEPCSADSSVPQCVDIKDKDGKDLKGECKEGLCVGLKEKDTCFNHQSCEVGLYCKGECKPLVELDQPCTESLQCKNGLICNGKKCVKPFSLNLGESVDSFAPSERNYACKSHFADYDDKKCGKRVYDSEQQTPPTDPEKVKSWTIECTSPKENCSYFIYYDDEGKNKKKISHPCNCSYGVNEGYCPYHDDHILSINKRTTFEAIVSGNKRHTLKRYEKNYSEQTKDDKVIYEDPDVNCDAFYADSTNKGISSCIKKVLGMNDCPGASSTLKTSFLILISLFITLLI